LPFDNLFLLPTGLLEEKERKVDETKSVYYTLHLS